MANSMNVSVSAENRINLATLQRVDPYIRKIVTSARQVALYKFSSSSEWEKTDTEGTLFVYEREGDPKYGFIILNRLSPKNLVEPVTKELDFQLQTPFLLYKTKEGSIFGIWFYEGKECQDVTKLIQGLVAMTNERMKQRETNKTKSGDLAALLSKAGQKTQQQKSPPKGKDPGEEMMRLLTGSDSHHRKPDSKKPQSKPHQNGSSSPAVPHSGAPSSDNVAAFFAKASEQQQHPMSAFTSPMGAPPPHPMSQAPTHPMAQAPPMQQMPMQPSMMPMFPVVSSAHLAAIGAAQAQAVMAHAAAIKAASEAQQMAQQRIVQQNAHPPEQNAGPGREVMMANLFSNPGVHSLENLERQQRLESVSPAVGAPENMVAPPMPLSARSADDLENDLKKKAVIDDGDLTSSYAAAARGPTEKIKLSPMVNNQPNLISPMAFVQNNPMDFKRTPIMNNNTNNVAINEETEVTPLTKNQLLQAVNHLLRKDSSFIDQLHQAYVESLTNKLR